MSDYTFRLRFNIPESTKIMIPDALFDLSGPHHPFLSLSANDKGKPIMEAKSLVLKGSGYASEAVALSNGETFRDALTLALAYCRIGADFGDRVGRGGFTKIGLSMLEQHSSTRVLNEVHGLIVYATNPPPSFAMLGPLTLILESSAEKFANAFARASASGYKLSNRERLSYSLFSSSFFHQSQEARLLFLVMSIEVLLDLQQRSPQVIEHIEFLIDQTQKAQNLPPSEKNSLIGAINWLHWESIRQGSRRLINTKLNGNIYDNRPAPDFFLDCYDLRSALVHGSQPYPNKDEVGKAAANLEVLVADLLSACIDWATV